MNPWRMVLLALLCVLVPACGGRGGGSPPVPSGPSITGVLPLEVDLGATITVDGSGFGAVQGASTLTIAGETATILTWSDAQITAVVPATARTGTVLVNLPGGPTTPGFLVVLWSVKDPANRSVASAANEQWSPSITTDGAGGTIVAWDDMRTMPGNRDIYVQRLSATGSPLWTANGIAICTQAGHQVDPKVVSDGAGGAIIVWTDGRTAPTGDDLYAQRVNANGTPQWTAGGVNVCNSMGSQTLSTVGSDGAGGVLLTWVDLSNIDAQRVSGAGVPLWTSTGVAVCAAAGNQGAPRVVGDGTGGGIFIWEDPRGPTDDVYAQRLNAAGTPQWTADGIPICNALDRQQVPDLVSDGAGGAIFVWQDYRADGVNPDVYAQRATASGTLLWTANGVVVSNAVNFQGQAHATSDGAGGVIVAWEDTRNLAFSTDVYAQRMNGAGVPLWTANGVAVCTKSGSQSAIALVTDGAGGAVIAWIEAFAINAQRVNAVGTPLWTTDGVPFSSTLQSYSKFALAPDGHGGAVAAWEDPRNYPSDIYAQGLSRYGH